MKSLIILKMLILVTFFFFTCQTNKKQDDSTEIAKEKNEEVFDDKDEENDADFIVNTISSSFAEIKLAQLALNKSNDVLVTNTATMLETDHTKLLQELQAYAAKKSITVPTTETDEAVKDRSDLAQEDPKDFDKKWCEKLEGSHKKSIRKFESRMTKTEDVELRNLISAALPSLRNHLEMLTKEHDRLN